MVRLCWNRSVQATNPSRKNPHHKKSEKDYLKLNPTFSPFQQEGGHSKDSINL